MCCGDDDDDDVNDAVDASISNKPSTALYSACQDTIRVSG